MTEEKFDWSKITEKKIFLYELKCAESLSDENLTDFKYIDLLMGEIQNHLSRYNYKDEKANKYYAIESISVDGSFYKIVLKNCKYNFTPDIINVDTQQEHASSKTLSEGDKEKTHVLISENKLFYENRRNGTSLSIFKNFLNQALKFIRSQLSTTVRFITFVQVLDNNFLDVLKRANKIRSTKFIVKSTLIGSDFFNFSDDNGVQDTYTLEVKAKKRNQFNKTNFIRKIESLLLAEDKSIEKITVDICDEDNNPRVINTDEFAKFYKIYVDKSITGEVVSEDMFNKMKGLF